MTAGRRGNGAGSITARPGGGWRVVVTITDPLTGARKQVSRYTRGTKREAQEILADMVTRAAGGNLAGTGATVAGLVAEWLDHDTELSPTTAADYRRVQAAYLGGPFGRRPAAKVTPSEVSAYYRHLIDEGAATVWRVRRLHEILRRAYNLGMRWEWLQRNPVELATQPKAPRTERQPPSPADAIRLLTAAPDDFAVWLRLAAVTGARRGEVCGLQWDDIDLDTLTVRFVRSVAYTSAAGVHVKDTKSGRPKVMAIDEATGRLLTMYRRMCVERALSVGRQLTGDCWAFSTELEASRPWRPDLATHRFVRLRNSLGLPGVRLHDLRHAMITTLLSEGTDPVTTSRRAGHGRTSTTTDIYAAWVPARDRDAADLLGRLYGDESALTL